MIFTRKRNKDQHEKRCNQEKTVKTRQKALGDNENELVKLVKSGYLPECFLNYRQKYLITFDIETLETPTDEAVSDFTVKEATHKLASLAVASNIPGAGTKFMQRESSAPIAEQMLIDAFVEELYRLYDLFMDALPKEIKESITRLESEIAELHFGHKKTKLQSMLKFLRQYTKLNIYAFNGGKFDYGVIFPALVRSLNTYSGEMPDVLKRGAKYFVISTPELRFNDTLNFSSPCSLSKYLYQWKVTETKSIWPYQHFKTVEEVRECTEFPGALAFYNTLKQKSVDADIYEKTRRFFNDCKALPPSDPLHMKTMADFLLQYL